MRCRPGASGLADLFLTGWVGIAIGQGYDANMRTAAADITDLIQSSSDALVGALRRATSDGLDVDELTQVLSAVSRQRNRIDSAVSGVIGTLDRVVEQAAEQGDLTMGLSCATWLSHNLQISSSAAHACQRRTDHGLNVQNAPVNDWLLPDGLPRGRLIVPNPSYVDGEALGPVLWVSDAPEEQPGELWNRLRAEHGRTGLWPLVLETLNGAPMRPWHDGELDPRSGPEGDPADVGLLLEALWGNGQPDDDEDEDPTMVRGDWPGLAARAEPEGDPDVVSGEVARGWFREPALIGLVPAPDGAAALRATGWLGSCNYTTTADVAAILASWQDRFGVRLLNLGFDTIGVSVAPPPSPAGHPLAISPVHFPIRPHNIFHAPFHSPPPHAP